MDRRTIFLQQLGQVSDFLVMQKHMMRSLAAMGRMLFNSPRIVGMVDTNANISVPAPGTNLRVVVPPLQLWEFGQTDPTSWSTLAADTGSIFLQGINYGSTTLALNATPDAALSIGAGNSIVYLIQGRVQRLDETPVILPFYPLIQMIIAASPASTTTSLRVDSTTGVSVGDQIIVQGIATANGLPTFVDTVNSATQITLTNALASAPGTGVTVRDVSPNDGVPLSGPGNSGATSNVDRVIRVELTVKAGTAASAPTVPAADSGWAPIYTVTLVHNATVVISGNIAIATVAPIFPSLVAMQHHKGSPGQSGKIDISGVESTYRAVNAAGDAMTGLLSLSGAPVNALHAANKGFAESRCETGQYTGDGTNFRLISISGLFKPTVVIVLPLGSGVSVPGESITVLRNQAGGRLMIETGPVGGDSIIYMEDHTDLFGQISITAGENGFRTGNGSTRCNINGTQYRYLAWD